MGDVKIKVRSKELLSCAKKRRRSASLKELKLVDQMVQAVSPTNLTSCHYESNNSQLELFCEASVKNYSLLKKEEFSASLQENKDCSKQPHKEVLKANLHESRSFNNKLEIQEKDEWFDTDLVLDDALLSYSTPLKNIHAKVHENKENEKSITAFNQNCKASSNSFQESWFEEIDLSLLEKECIEKNVPKCNAQPIEEVPNINEQVSVSNSCKKVEYNSETTPISEKCSFRAKLRKRLVENARKTPQLLSPSINVESEKVNEKSVYVGESKVDLNDLSTQDLGPFYGLPSTVKHLLEKLRGIKVLYDWQNECLQRDEIKKGKNLIYSLPTSGGKTLVAEILIMKTLLCHKKNAILVLPFVAIVQEKIESLSQFAVELGFLIEEYAGGKGKFPPRKRRKKNVLYVCTIEKASTLVNSLIESNRLDELKLIVVDELHMIGEGGKRGATIEMMLTKLLYLSAPIQIIGMSATLSNSEELASFLEANVFLNEFRPVKLDEYLKVTDCIYKINSTKLHPDDQLVKERTLSQTTRNNVIDTDHLASLVLEVVPEHSCLVFCPTKRNCENVALLICKFLPRKLTQHRQKEKKELLKALQTHCGDVCPTLWKVIPYGVAYHHSGLTSDERHVIEDGYRNGVLAAITCTSTLAAGVNLPARRVIIRSPHIGQGFLSRAQYKQMIGRAGRAGIDTRGESYLIVSKPEDRLRIRELISGPMETCISSLLYDKGKGFRSLLLSLISLKVISNTKEANSFFSKTLCYKQWKLLENILPSIVEDCGTCEDNEQATSKIVTCTLQYLLNMKLIERTGKGDDVTFVPTILGKAASKCGIDFDICSMLYEDLKRGLESLVLENFLHLLYLITPYDASFHVSPNWLIYMSEINQLSSAELAAASVVGVPEQYIVRRASGCNPKKKKVSDLVVSRFYVTLMLYKLFKGQSVWDVAVSFEQPRGFLQSLLMSSASFASCVLRFSQEFEQFWPYQALLEKLIDALQYCRVTELVPLMEISSVKMARAKQLYKAGYKSLSQVASASPSTLVEKVEHLSRRQAQLIIASAKVLLTEKIDSLQEEMEQLKNIDF